MKYAVHAEASNGNGAFGIGRLSFHRDFGQFFGLVVGSLVF